MIVGQWPFSSNKFYLLIRLAFLIFPSNLLQNNMLFVNCYKVNFVVHIHLGANMSWTFFFFFVIVHIVIRT